MTNPYGQQPDRAFWSRAVARPDPETVDPVARAQFTIARGDRVATVGSCFAQHLSRALAARGFASLITEDGPVERGYGVYPARFGNLYTARQLLQLFQRAFGLFLPDVEAWSLGDRFVDPFRPQVEPGGFATLEDLHADRVVHLAAVRRMFETADVLTFTLGLTESWVSVVNGAVVPLAPGVAGDAERPDDYRPHNFSVQETVEDLTAFIAMARILRPGLRVLLTVSPVPLIATIGRDHVLSATAYSKAVLRVAAETIVQSHYAVDYFPSYEIVTGPHHKHSFLADDLRTVRSQGVAHVMDIFARHYLKDIEADDSPMPSRVTDSVTPDRREEHVGLSAVVCDEEAIEQW